jgi:arsenite methyltransferase
MTQEGEMSLREDVRRRYGNLAMTCHEGSLSCGNPFSLVDLKPGDRVLDLGAGGDELLSAGRVGPTGKAWGLDMTPEMLDRARARALERGASNVEFHEGYIEDIPLPEASVDVVISNCVLVLSADKSAVFKEIARVLVPVGRVAIADLILDGVETTGAACCAPSADCGDPIDAMSYSQLLAAAGLVGVSIEATHTYAPGVASAAIRAEPGYAGCLLSSPDVRIGLAPGRGHLRGGHCLRARNFRDRCPRLGLLGSIAPGGAKTRGCRCLPGVGGLGSRFCGFGAKGLRGSDGAQRLCRSFQPGPRCWRSSAQDTGGRKRTTRFLDDPVRSLPREPGKPRPASEGGFP